MTSALNPPSQRKTKRRRRRKTSTTRMVGTTSERWILGSVGILISELRLILAVETSAPPLQAVVASGLLMTGTALTSLFQCLEKIPAALVLEKASLRSRVLVWDRRGAAVYPSLVLEPRTTGHATVSIATLRRKALRRRRTLRVLSRLTKRWPEPFSRRLTRWRMSCDILNHYPSKSSVRRPRRVGSSTGRWLRFVIWTPRSKTQGRIWRSTKMIADKSTSPTYRCSRIGSTTRKSCSTPRRWSPRPSGMSPSYNRHSRCWTSSIARPRAVLSTWRETGKLWRDRLPTKKKLCGAKSASWLR
mmetsp:Transcript_13662/g.33090  ORF Transcript_13662/g.33090 Transcript_13662/m.33090 type:complete len:302 (-) Transcript_13662:375-1280(-)